MGYHFYTQMLNKIGTAPGYKGKRRRRKVAWDDEKRQQAVDMYLASDPTPETSMEIVEAVAEELGETINGVRMILSKAEVYVKKNQPTKAAAKGNGGGRTSKAAAHEALISAITDSGQDPNEEIISKLTGKAALYLAEVINQANA
jgi:hypothetical protein